MHVCARVRERVRERESVRESAQTRAKGKTFVCTHMHVYLAAFHSVFVSLDAVASRKARLVVIEALKVFRA